MFLSIKFTTTCVVQDIHTFSNCGFVVMRMTFRSGACFSLSCFHCAVRWLGATTSVAQHGRRYMVCESNPEQVNNNISLNVQIHTADVHDRYTHQMFKTDTHSRCSQHTRTHTQQVFTTDTHIRCSQKIHTADIHKIHTTGVHNRYTQQMFTTDTHSRCPQHI